MHIMSTIYKNMFSRKLTNTHVNCLNKEKYYFVIIFIMKQFYFA